MGSASQVIEHGDLRIRRSAGPEFILGWKGIFAEDVTVPAPEGSVTGTNRNNIVYKCLLKAPSSFANGRSHCHRGYVSPLSGMWFTRP